MPLAFCSQSVKLKLKKDTKEEKAQQCNCAVHVSVNGLKVESAVVGLFITHHDTQLGHFSVFK